MALEDAIVLAESLADATSLAEAFRLHERRRRARTEWVTRQTQRRDRMRGLPPVLRHLILRGFGRKLFYSNHRPLRGLP